MIETELVLTNPVKCKKPKFEHFDKDGFDLTLFEAMCYEANGFPVDHTSNHLVYRRNWLTLSFPENIRADHSYMCFRLKFDGELAEQIKQLSVKYNMPQLLKLLYIRPKAGVDVNIEYIFNDGKVMDLLHYEEDFVGQHLNKFDKRICELERLIQDTDWKKFALQLMDKRLMWCTLTGDDENDYKAKLLGLDRAYKTYKVI